MVSWGSEVSWGRDVMGEGLFLKWGKVLRTYSVNGKAMGGKVGGGYFLFVCLCQRVIQVLLAWLVLQSCPYD